MIEELIGKLKSELGEQLTSKANIPAGNVDGVFSVVGDVVKKEATKEMLGGNVSNLMSLFSDMSNDAGANQIQSNMASGIVSQLMSKLGISQEQSKMVTEMVLPALIVMVSKKTGGSKDATSVLTELFGGGDKGGLGGLAKGLLGGFMK
jgi:hypothetical protein